MSKSKKSKPSKKSTTTNADPNGATGATADLGTGSTALVRVADQGDAEQAADALSGARPGARREMMETYVKRLDDLERIAASFSGVLNSFAIQAGREIRVMVSSDEVSDERAVVLAKDVAKKIEAEMTYPGQIKVNVIRETRAIEYAR